MIFLRTFCRDQRRRLSPPTVARCVLSFHPAGKRPRDRLRALPPPQVDAQRLLERGLRSISMQGFSEVIELLVPMIRADGVSEPPRGYNSEHLKTYLAKKGIFLPSFYDKKFSLDSPDVVVTYMWLGTTLRELLAILREIFAGRNGTVWIDVCFNDQRSPQVRRRDQDS